MSIEFRIKQHGEKHCYSNWTMNLKSFLTALYSNESPYEALMSLDRNNQLSDDNYTRDKRNGLITYDIDFDRDTITRHEKGRQFKLNEMSKIPLGAAYSLMRFHGAGVPAAVSDCEYDEFMLGFFKKLNIDLIDFKIEFGKTADGTIILADEISPDTCRFWDSTTHEKLDKDRFRRDMGGVEEAYQEIMKRLMGE